LRANNSALGPAFQLGAAIAVTEARGLRWIWRPTRIRLPSPSNDSAHESYLSAMGGNGVIPLSKHIAERGLFRKSVPLFGIMSSE
jgi:hypothetical protein